MIDLSNETIKRIFDDRMHELTLKAAFPLEESFEYQFSGEWLK